MSNALLSEDRGAVRLLTLNRPAKLNALDFALTRALVDAFRAAEADAGVGAVVLTGAGRGFCSGADTDEFKLLTPDNQALVDERSVLSATLQGLPLQLSKPVIAAVNGVARGGGAGLALSSDMVVMAKGASFGYPELKRGIVAAVVMSSLVRAVGRKAAFEMVALGRPVEAEKALALGMVNRVVDEAELVPVALDLATALAGSSREAMALTKELFYRTLDLPFAEALEQGRQANRRMRAFRT